MRLLHLVLLVLGLALFVGLVAWRGVGDVVAILATAGWQLAWLPVFFITIALAVHTAGWLRLFQPGEAPRYGPAAAIGCIGIAVNELLPVAQVGGEVVRARLAHKAGVPSNAAVGTVIVDKTLQAVVQPLYALIGLALLSFRAAERDVYVGALVFIVGLGVALYAFYRVQRAGIFAMLVRLGRFMGWKKSLAGLSEGAETLDETIRAIYRRRGELAQALVLRLAYRAVLAVEVWLALVFFEQPMPFVDVIILTSLSEILVAAAFAVPGALGVREGSFILLGAAVGIGPDIALSIALARRFREIAVGLPALALWQVIEGRALLARRRGSGSTGSGMTE